MSQGAHTSPRFATEARRRVDTASLSPDQRRLFSEHARIGKRMLPKRSRDRQGVAMARRATKLNENRRDSSYDFCGRGVEEVVSALEKLRP